MTSYLLLICRKCKAAAHLTVVGYGAPSEEDARRAEALLVGRGGVVTYTWGKPQLCDLCCCGARVKVVPVRGKVKRDHPCDARCLAGRGGTCECACGGRNHGRAYAA